MANALFTNYKNLLLGGGNHTLPDMDTDDIRLALIDEGTDTPVPATDEDIADIIAGARVAVSNALDSPVITAGAIDFADEVLTSVSGATVESVVVWGYNATETIAPLIVYYDTGTGLPLTPNGGNVTVAFNASGLFSF